MFERFTDQARKVVALANQEAQGFNHEYIGTEHILLGLITEGAGVGAHVLKNLGVDLRRVRSGVEKLVKRGPTPVSMGKLPYTPRAKRVFEYAIEESRNLSHNYIGTEHLLLGLLRETEGIAAQVLTNLGADLERGRAETLTLLGANLDQSAVRGASGMQPKLGTAGPGGVGAPPLPEPLQNDVAAALLHVLLCELNSRKDAAVRDADYESASKYRNAVTHVSAAQEVLLDLLKGQSGPSTGKAG